MVKSRDILLSHARMDHSAAIYGLCIRLEHRTILTASGDRYIAEWSMNDLSPTGLAVKLQKPAYCVFAIPATSLMVVGNSEGAFHVIDLETKKEIRLLSAHRQGVYGFSYIAHQNILISTGGDGSIALWDIPSFDLIRQIPFGETKIRRIALSPDGKEIALASADGFIRILDTEFFNEIQTISAHEGGAVCCAYSPKKPVLYTGGRDGYLRIYNRKEGYNRLIELPAHYTSIYSIALSPTEDFLVTTSRDKSFKIWDLPTLEVIEKIEARHGGHSHSVNDCVWLNEYSFVTCGDDRKILRVEIKDSPN